MIFVILMAFVVFIASMVTCAVLSLIMGLVHKTDWAYAWFSACVLFGLFSAVVYIFLKVRMII